MNQPPHPEIFRSRFPALLAILATAALLPAGRIDTVAVFSPAMHKPVPALVVVPDREPGQVQAFPAVYLLHGYGGSYLDWSARTDLRTRSDVYGFIIVCPDGSANSWYLDSPVDSSSRYETHITQELIPWMGEHYPVESDRRGRAVSGLSMGGHGALYLAIRHPGLFAAAGSMSGGVDLTYSTKRWEIAEKLGSYKEFPGRWRDHSVLNMIPQLKAGDLEILIDCGIGDMFIGINRELHQRLLESGIPHVYVERPGGHSWDYWIEALDWHLLFFRRVFQEAADPP